MGSRSSSLQRFFSSFPEGSPAAGLVLLRLVAGLSALLRAVHLFAGQDNAHGIAGLAAILYLAASLGLLTGLLTPVAGVLSTGLYLTNCVQQVLAKGLAGDELLAGIAIATIAASLTLLGPGAFSLDARIFGRHVILIPDGKRPQHERK